MKKYFLNDKFILSLIILNSMIIFFTGFSLNTVVQNIFHIIDNFFTLLFALEVFFKIKEYNLKGYFSDKWNLFDFILVLLSVPELFSLIIQFNSGSLSMLLVFRTLRVFKSFRFLKFVPGIGHLILGFKRALKASVIVFVTIFIFIFIFGVVSYQLFGHITPRFFGNPIRSVYSVFRILTIEGWFEIPEEVSKDMSGIKSFLVYNYFIFILFAGGIIGLSLMNSIFVDAMVSDNNDQLEQKVSNIEQKVDTIVRMLNQTGDYGSNPDLITVGKPSHSDSDQ